MEITIKELKKNLPNWNPTSPEQEKKMLELVKKAQQFVKTDPIQEK